MANPCLDSVAALESGDAGPPPASRNAPVAPHERKNIPPPRRAASKRSPSPRDPSACDRPSSSPRNTLCHRSGGGRALRPATGACGPAGSVNVASSRGPELFGGASQIDRCRGLDRSRSTPGRRHPATLSAPAPATVPGA